MENHVSPTEAHTVTFSPKKNVNSPIKRQILKEIYNVNTSQISNGDSKLSNSSGVSPSKTLSATPELQVSVNKGSDESSDSSLDYGSANEETSNRDDSLINAFNDFHLNTPKADGKKVTERILVTSLDGSVKFECNNLTSDFNEESIQAGSKNDTVLQTSDSHSLRKQKVFNIITESFETPESSLIEDTTLTICKENFEIGQDPLNVSTDIESYNLNIPTIDPVLERSESPLRKSPVPTNFADVDLPPHTIKDVNSTFDVYDADDIAIISAELSINGNDISSCQPQDNSVSNVSEVKDKLLSDFASEGVSDKSVGVSSIDDSNLSHLDTKNVEDNFNDDGIAVIEESDNQDKRDDLQNENIKPSMKDAPDIAAKLDFSDKIQENEIAQSLVDTLNHYVNATEDLADNLEELHNIRHDDNVQQSLSTTFEIPSDNQQLNTTLSEPMDCDVSFVSHAPNNVVQPLENYSFGNQINRSLEANVTTDNLQVQCEPVDENNKSSVNVSVCEAMDCDDFCEIESIISPQINIDYNLDVNSVENTESKVFRNIDRDYALCAEIAANSLEQISINILKSSDIPEYSIKDIKEVDTEQNIAKSAEHISELPCTQQQNDVNIDIVTSVTELSVLGSMDNAVCISKTPSESNSVNNTIPLLVKQTPVKQDTMSQPLDDKEFNPFVTKSKILNTPDKDVCLSPSTFNITESGNPFVTKSRVLNTPDRDVLVSSGIDRVNAIASQTDQRVSFVTDSSVEESVKNDSQSQPANCSNISDEEIPAMVFNDAELINDEISSVMPSESKIENEVMTAEQNSDKMENVSVELNQIQVEIAGLSVTADDCLDEEFKRPLVLQSELMNTDLDFDSDSDTLSVCSSTNLSELNPFETKSKIVNSPERDLDNTLIFNRTDSNENADATLNATLVAQNDLDVEQAKFTECTTFDVEGNIVNAESNANPATSPKSLVSSVCHGETILISDSPGVNLKFKSPPVLKDTDRNICETSPQYNDNTPKTAKPNRRIEERDKKDFNFVPPLLQDKRVKELAKKTNTEKKKSNLSPMSRCGDLMGLSPVTHTEEECANRFDQISDEDFNKDPFFCDDLEEEFKMPANFIKDPLDFLLSCNSNATNQYQCKESLLLKFDPLLNTGRAGLPTGVRPGRETIPESPRVEEDASTASGLVESCSSDSSPLSTSTTEGKTFGKMSSMDQSLGAPSPKVLNVTPQPVEKPTQVVTPAISTRQSVTSISAKNSTVTPTKSVTSAIAAIDRLISLGGTPPPPPVVVQPKEPDMDPRVVAELQSVKDLLAKQEEELHKVEDQKQNLETQLSDAVSREQTLIERLNDKTKDRRQMDTVLEEYERTMTQFIGEREVEKRQWEEERAALIRERDEANAHLANMEHSFNDIHAKYERCKAMIQGYKANEEILKETVRSNDEASKKQLERYEHLRQHAMSQLEIANQEIESVKKASQAEIIKLQAMFKKSEISATSLQESLVQKTKDIEELTAICDELIQKVG